MLIRIWIGLNGSWGSILFLWMLILYLLRRLNSIISMNIIRICFVYFKCITICQAMGLYLGRIWWLIVLKNIHFKCRINNNVLILTLFSLVLIDWIILQNVNSFLNYYNLNNIYKKRNKNQFNLFPKYPGVVPEAMVSKS